MLGASKSTITYRPQIKVSEFTFPVLDYNYISNINMRTVSCPISDHAGTRFLGNGSVAPRFWTGSAFTQSNTVSVWNISDCATDGSIIFACGNGQTQVYKSIDGGNFFTALPSLTQSVHCVVCSNDGQTLFIGHAAGEYSYSINGGASWAGTNLNTGSPSSIVANDARVLNGGQWIVVKQNTNLSAQTEFYISKNFGATFNPLVTPTPCAWWGTMGDSLVYTRGGSGTQMWKTDDLSNFYEIGLEPGTSQNGGYIIGDRENDQWGYYMSLIDKQILMTSNGGNSWTDTGINVYDDSNNFFVFNIDQRNMYASTNYLHVCSFASGTSNKTRTLLYKR